MCSWPAAPALVSPIAGAELPTWACHRHDVVGVYLTADAPVFPPSLPSRPERSPAGRPLHRGHRRVAAGRAAAAASVIHERLGASYAGS
jgi:hypothetical protein